MHYVDRGPEPPGLDDIRVQYTSRWIGYYKLGNGRLPTDSHWRKFHNDLYKSFHGVCGYCEKMCRGEVDHFQPKSLRPDLVYCWINWIFSCHDCNTSKGARWPKGGYVDPCAECESSRPEHHFRFDTLTGEILPADGLDDHGRNKAQSTIDDLSLNAHHHLRSRLERLIIVRGIIPDDPSMFTDDIKLLFDYLVSRDTPLSSLTRAWLSQQGYSI